jgi:enoyl-CoA hydratase/carnithine racemase
VVRCRVNLGYRLLRIYGTTPGHLSRQTLLFNQKDGYLSDVDPVLVSRGTDGVTTVTLNRPGALNAVDHALTCALSSALRAIRADRSCRVVILTGAGRAFSAGYDLVDYGDDREATDGQMLGRLHRQQAIAALVCALHELPQPVIAAVNGPAMGAGLALTCASDIRLAADDALFAVAFITAGCSGCDLGVSWLLPRLVGAGRAHELMLTGRRFSAAEALESGLLARVTSGDDLLPTARSMAELVLRNPPASVALTKTGMWTALETPSLRTVIEFENRQQMVTAATADAAEAAAAFVEKRAPRYTGR